MTALYEARIGLNANLYRNTGTYGSPTWVAVTNVKDLTLGIKKAEADVSTRGNNGWEAIVETLKKGDISFGMVDNPADAQLQAISAAFFANPSTPIEFAIMDGAMTDVNSQGLRALFSIIEFSREEKLEEGIMYNVGIKPTFSAHPPAWITGSA